MHAYVLLIFIMFETNNTRNYSRTSGNIGVDYCEYSCFCNVFFCTRVAVYRSRDEDFSK